LPSAVPIFNLQPPSNAPALFGFHVFETDVKIVANVRTDGDYGVRALSPGISETLGVMSGKAVFWGVPADPRHDLLRGLQCNGSSSNEGIPGNASCKGGNLSAGIPPKPFLSMPTDCNEANPATFLRGDSWQNPAPSLDNFDQPQWVTYRLPAPQATECASVMFAPSILLAPSTKNSDSPTGVSVEMAVSQSTNPTAPATGHLKDAVVTLPVGMSVNPSAADGIQGCTSAQIGLLGTNFPMPNPVRFAKGDANCPQASKIGTGVVETTLLEEPLKGDVYLAAPKDNPFGAELALYLVFRGPGFIVKLAGRVEADESTGRLTSRFENNPQLPFDKLTLDFFGGPRAPLATSPVCGTQPIETTLTPWSHPGSGPPATPQNRYTADQGPAGAPCSSSLASRPFGPEMSSGTESPIAGGHSNLTMRLTRPDGHQELAGLTVRPPLGFTAKLAGMPYCSESQIAAAKDHTGRAEAANSSCPAAARVGQVLTGAGAGPTPLFTPGTAYLAGPYKGAPLSLAIVVPAIAGGTPGNPVFDLGTVVVRVALHVNPINAQITAISDPVPQTLTVPRPGGGHDGFPLRVRDIRVRMDRPEWGINPTSCAEKSFGADLDGRSGASVTLVNRFQVVECANLGFKPRLNLTLKGGTKRGAHPALRAVVRPRPGDANIRRAMVTLPSSAFLDQSHIRTICTRVQWANDDCPKAAIYGHASALSPLLDQPLTGPVYLRSSDNLLPDVVVDLRGPAHQPIRIELAGRVDSVKGGIRNTFEATPDAPVSRFVLEMQGGKKGLIVNSRNICKGTNRARARVGGHNGATHSFRPRVVGANCAKQRKRHNR
jgi:hypothetical protein